MKPEGFLIAGVAFVLTRGLLIDVFYRSGDESLLVVVTRLLPLILGLGIVVFGVSLAVSTKNRTYIRTVTLWYLVGSTWMLFLTGVAVFESAEPLIELRRSGVVATIVVGGGVGGLLMGIRSADNQQQRQSLNRQTEQTVLLNRLLRHEVLNALTAIRGHAGLLADGRGGSRSFDAVASNVDRIEQTVDDVGFIVRTADGRKSALGSIDISTVIRRCQDRLPDADRRIVVDDIPPVRVRADDHLDTVLANLLTVALERTSDGDVTVDLDFDETMVDLIISAPGNWLSESEREVLLNGVPEYDTPEVQFGVPITRLLVAEYGGGVEVDTGGSETSVTVGLLRIGSENVPANTTGVETVDLRNAATAGVIAGAVMGAILQLFSGQIGIIGGLYGVQTPAVGWITHLFHSVVFAILFVALWNRYRPRTSIEGFVEPTVLGAGFGFVLWLVAAGIVMGVWLNVVGIGSPVPNLGLVSLAGHLSWGGVLGISYTRLPA